MCNVLVLALFCLQWSLCLQTELTYTSWLTSHGQSQHYLTTFSILVSSLITAFMFKNTLLIPHFQFLVAILGQEVTDTASLHFPIFTYSWLFMPSTYLDIAVTLLTENDNWEREQRGTTAVWFVLGNQRWTASTRVCSTGTSRRAVSSKWPSRAVNTWWQTQLDMHAAQTRAARTVV